MNSMRTCWITTGLAAAVFAAPAFLQAQDFVIESAADGRYNEKYSELTGTWVIGKDKSRASKLSPTAAAHQLVIAEGAAPNGSVKFQPYIPSDGTYLFDLTWPAGSNVKGLTWSFENKSIKDKKTFPMGSDHSDTWVNMGEYVLAKGDEPVIIISTSAETAPNDPGKPLAIFMDALHVVKKEEGPAGLADPFGGAAGEHSPDPAPDPFGNPGGGTVKPVENPFGAPAATGDPFGTAPVAAAAPPQPVAANTTRLADPCGPGAAPPATTAGPFGPGGTASAFQPGSASGDPFAAATAPGGGAAFQPGSTSGDPFAAAPPGPPESAASNDPFAPPQPAAPASGGVENPFNRAPTEGVLMANPFEGGPAVAVPLPTPTPSTTAALALPANPFDAVGGAAPPTFETVPAVTIEPARPAPPPVSAASTPSAPAPEPVAATASNFAAAAQPREAVPLFAAAGKTAGADASAVAPAPQVVWLDNLEDAKKAAQTQGRQILLVFVSENKQTETFKAETLGNREVAEAIQTYVPVQLDLHYESETAMKFNVTKAPYAVVVNKMGYTRSHVSYISDPRRFARELRTLSK
ncbi:hypothetical protein HZA57_01420 [Candidatus Poribacteria bacterium]|nr:hypothetical protein [Candidatus Poribacteria bacterium]